MKRVVRGALCVCTLHWSSAFAVSFSGPVLRISDGDTIAVSNAGKQVKVRFGGIDAPEIDHPGKGGQAGGEEAKQFLIGLIDRQWVTVEIETTDKYGRTVGIIYLRDGTNINAEMIRNGWAWWYTEHYPTLTLAARYEAEARKAGIGIWQDSDPEPPWIFRNPERQEEWERTKCEIDTQGCPSGGTSSHCSVNVGSGVSFEEFSENECVTGRLLEYQFCRAGLPFDSQRMNCGVL
ncbi:MAG: thermonuclease family protein [Pseudomonadota bacterium]